MRINKRTLTALKGSIAKWRRIVAGTGEDHRADNCPLCQIFSTNFACGGCPVARKTGQGGCYGTPYADWYWAKTGRYKNRLAVAKRELAFLRSLLPKKKVK